MRWPRVRRDQSPALALLNLTGRPCCQLAPYMSPDLRLEMQISWALPTCSTRVVCCPSLRRWGMARPPSKGMTCSSLGKREPHNSFWQAISLCVSIDASCRQSGMAACHLPVWITIERISFFLCLGSQIIWTRHARFFLVLIFKGVSSLAYAVLWFAGTMRCPRAVRTGFVLLCEILTFPVLAFAGVSTHGKNAWLKVCHMLLICVSFLCSVTLGDPVYLAVFLVCENRVCLSFLILLEMCVVSLM